MQVEHGGVDKICASYSTRHPELLCSNGVIDYNNGKVIEVYAYYLPDANQKNTNKPDRGTILRFSEEHGGDKLLPGLLHVDHKFADNVAVPAYVSFLDDARSPVGIPRFPSPCFCDANGRVWPSSGLCRTHTPCAQHNTRMRKLPPYLNTRTRTRTHVHKHTGPVWVL